MGQTLGENPQTQVLSISTWENSEYFSSSSTRRPKVLSQEREASRWDIVDLLDSGSPCSGPGSLGPLDPPDPLIC